MKKATNWIHSPTHSMHVDTTYTSTERTNERITRMYWCSLCLIVSTAAATLHQRHITLLIFNYIFWHLLWSPPFSFLLLRWYWARFHWPHSAYNLFCIMFHSVDIRSKLKVMIFLVWLYLCPISLFWQKIWLHRFGAYCKNKNVIEVRDSSWLFFDPLFSRFFSQLHNAEMKWIFSKLFDETFLRDEMNKNLKDLSPKIQKRHL